MRLLEITVDEVLSPAVLDAHELQREQLAREFDYSRLDLAGRSQQDRARAVDMARVPDMVLLRGVSDFYPVGRAFPQAKFIVDHCSHVDLGQAPPGQHVLMRANVLCYSEAARDKLRAAGARKVTVLPGPWLRDLREEKPKERTVRVGFVPTPWARAAALDTLREGRERRWTQFEYYTTEKIIGTSRVLDAVEMAVVCDVLVHAQESEDLGAPHDGAILAAAYGCGLVSTALSALEAAGLQKDVHFALAPKYTRGGYAKGLQDYLENRDTLDRGVASLTPDPDVFIRALRSLSP